VAVRHLEVRRVRNRLVANVAELVVARLADNSVVAPALLIDLFAVGARRAVLDVDVGVVVEPQMLGDELLRQRRRQQSALFLQTLRVLFEVLLTLGIGAARPAHPREAHWTLQMRAAGPVLRNRGLALDVGTRLRAVLNEQQRELGRINLVLVANVLELLLIARGYMQVYPVE